MSERRDDMGYVLEYLESILESLNVVGKALAKIAAEYERVERIKIPPEKDND